jgi:catechol 2,3-dioxygenase
LSPVNRNRDRCAAGAAVYGNCLGESPIAAALPGAQTLAMTPDHQPIDAGARIGNVHLRVSDLERSVRFYRDALGFSEQGRVGDAAAFLSAGDYHHHIALNTWQSANGTKPPRGSTGLYYFGIRYPTRDGLAGAVERLLAHDVIPASASDHGVCESVYVDDPDGNGIELYCDRPHECWPQTADGRLALIDMPLDIRDLIGGR